MVHISLSWGQLKPPSAYYGYHPRIVYYMHNIIVMHFISYCCIHGKTEWSNANICTRLRTGLHQALVPYFNVGIQVIFLMRSLGHSAYIIMSMQ